MFGVIMSTVLGASACAGEGEAKLKQQVMAAFTSNCFVPGTGSLKETPNQAFLSSGSAEAACPSEPQTELAKFNHVSS